MSLFLDGLDDEEEDLKDIKLEQELEEKRKDEIRKAKELEEKRKDEIRKAKELEEKRKKKSKKSTKKNLSPKESWIDKSHSNTENEKQINKRKEIIKKFNKIDSYSELEEKRKAEKKEIKKKLIKKQTIKNKIPKTNQNKTSVKMTLDGIRGLYRLTTGIGDKFLTKTVLEKELKQQLLDPKKFGVFLSNLATYLQET